MFLIVMETLTIIVDKEDEMELQEMINNHLNYTGSELAREILINWEAYLNQFIKVIPFEYKKILQEIKLEQIKSEIEKTEDEPHFQY